MIFSVFVDSAGYVYSTGEFKGIADFDPGPDEYLLVSGAEYWWSSFVQKLDTDGNFVWARCISSGSEMSDDCHAYSITCDNYSYVYITGDFSGTVDFDPNSETTYNLTASGEYQRDIFILKLDINGGFESVGQIGDNGIDEAFAMTRDPQGDIYITGKFTLSSDFDPGPDEFYLTATTSLWGWEDIFILKLNTLIPVQIFESIEDCMLIYPNPSHVNFTVMGNGNFSLYDCYGREVYNDVLLSPKNEIKTTINPGMYFAELFSNGKIFRQTLIIY